MKIIYIQHNFADGKRLQLVKYLNSRVAKSTYSLVPCDNRPNGTRSNLIIYFFYHELLVKRNFFMQIKRPILMLTMLTLLPNLVVFCQKNKLHQFYFCGQVFAIAFRRHFVIGSGRDLQLECFQRSIHNS